MKILSWPTSARLFARAQKVLPGGVDSPVRAFKAVGGDPLFVRAATGRDRIIKFEGCYHGHADQFLVKAGSGATTLGVPTSPGVPRKTAQHTLIATYNDLSSCERLCDSHRHQIAALVVEPLAGNMGVVLPSDGFLAGLR